MPDEYFDFETFFNEKVKARGLSLEKISDLTGISLKHLENLSRGRYEEMPAAPYFRGYLVKLGGVLDFDPQIWWERFQIMGAVKRSGPEDKLPGNRFVIRSKTKYVAAAFLGLLVILYFGFRLPAIMGKPSLTIEQPREETVTANSARYKVYGYARNANQVAIGTETLLIEEDGYWEKELFLEEGLNTVTVTAKKLLGRETSETRRIIYEVPPPESQIESIILD